MSRLAIVAGWESYNASTDTALRLSAAIPPGNV
jgi:hypothetical protein